MGGKILNVQQLICLFFLQVQAWLTQVFGDESSVPPYEHTSDCIDVLHQLMTASQLATKSAEILHQDYINKANEYKAKGTHDD